MSCCPRACPEPHIEEQQGSVHHAVSAFASVLFADLNFGSIQGSSFSDD